MIQLNGKEMRRLRLEQKLSFEEVAVVADVGVRVIQRYEAESARTNKNIRDAIARKLKCKPEDITAE